MMPSSRCGIVHATCAESRARVLIVDDEPLVRWSLAAGLRLAGFDALTASARAEALAFARLVPRPDVVLLDSRMYNTNAAALLEDLRQAAPGCQFMMLTTSGHEAPAADGGLFAVIRKPFDLAEVVRLVTAAVAQLNPSR